MAAEVHDIEENQPHKASMVICIKCVKRWVAARPVQTKLANIECPGCGHIGYVIETGETI